MPRPRPPPTPTSSTDLQALEKTVQVSDLETVFTLPPPALRSNEADTHTRPEDSKSATQKNSIAIPMSQNTPPISPKDKPLTASPRHKRTASGAFKSSSQQSFDIRANSSYELPPPPSRARKIIQMKPKPTATAQSSPDSDASYQPSASAASVANPGPKSTGTSRNSKQKQPSATSAAGRKIARKTAHSIIERRRRSKMNEEFGVLKDMIPACEGVEMHKLAILQAGIEYVRYLEGCVAQLKAENEKRSTVDLNRRQVKNQMADEADEEAEQENGDDTGEDLSRPNSPVRQQGFVDPSPTGKWSLRDSRNTSIASSSSSSYPSPYLLSQPQSQFEHHVQVKKQGPDPTARSGSSIALADQSSPQSIGSSATPTPTLLSPAFNGIHFSPNLDGLQTNSSASLSAGSGSPGLVAPSTSSSWATVNRSSDPSPKLQPLPSPTSAMHLSLPHPPSFQLAGSSLQLSRPLDSGHYDREAHSSSPGGLSDVSATAEATASAALMMLTNEWRGGGRNNSHASRLGGSHGKVKGMSVRDLLTS